MRHLVSHIARIAVTCGLLLVPASGRAQGTPPPAPGTPEQVSQEDGALRLRLPTITVTAQKESENIQDAPVSVTAVTGETLQDAGIRNVSEAAQFAPNTFFSEFTARKLSNPRFRGIGASPNNPSVTTYVDGVPQLNANSSSIELVDVEQIEFVRGAQSALFGRNTLGGLINITSRRPSLAGWSGSISGPFGNFGAGDVRGDLSGPLVPDKLALGFAGGFSRRDGFTTNDVTGNSLDNRSAGFGKLQLLWTPSPAWTVRGILSGESAHDGDYALQDLATLRTTPYRTARTIEGYTRRGLFAPTVIVTHTGQSLTLTTTTGIVWWKTRDLTDLDYTAAPLITRSNDEKDLQFTQEVQIASAKNASLKLSDRVALKWQAGSFLFTQRYTQDAVNSFSPGFFYQANQPPAFVPFDSPANSQHSPQSSLDDNGIGVYGRGTVMIMDKLDLSVGVRGDYERKTADLRTFYTTTDPILVAFGVGQPTTLTPEKSFSDVSPQFTAAYHVTPGRTVYATASRGFKAGGFNPASPVGSEAYNQEHSWNYEAGAKTSWLADRLSVNGAVFFLDWSDLQVNVPNPTVPGQFYISNAGAATSKGVEGELSVRPLEGLDLFGGVGYTHARFSSGSVSGGSNVGGNRLSNTPDYTLNAGVQHSCSLTSALMLFGRADVVRYGAYQYDDANTASQEAYAIANFRVGVRARQVFVEGWMRNAFNTFYVPTAFAYPGLAPSGFVGESGAARTFGLRAGLTF
ncbi:MAG: TonB-dependent receptor [Vicinamibacterales bacterium]